jgi:hypothetical protein
MSKHLKINLLPSILVILIFFIPLYPKFPLASVENSHVFIRLDDIVVALAILSYFIYQAKHRFPVLKHKITPLFTVYYLAISLSTLHAILIFQTEPTHILLLHLLRRFQYTSLFFISLSALKIEKKLNFTYLAFYLSTLAVCFYGYGQKYFHLPVISTMNYEFAKGQLLQMGNWVRISSTFAGHYDLAAYLSAALIIIVGVSIINKNIFIKISGLILYLLAFHNLTLTASRVSIFAFWAAVILTLLFLKKYLWIIPISALVVVSLLTSKDLNQRLIATIYTAFPTRTPTAIPTSLPNPTPKIIPTLPPKTVVVKTTPLPTPLPTVIRHEIEEPLIIDADAGVARSGEIRFNAEWPRAINAYRKNPISGTGLGSITLATDNDYLRSLGESGILGFLSFSVIIIYFFVRTFPSIKAKTRNQSQQLNIIFFGSFLVYLANAAFIDVFEASKTAYMFWIMTGIYYYNLDKQKT